MKLDSKPIVSVIMPMFNAEAFVLAALASIIQEQSVPLEIIVVNDGSTDTSLATVETINDHRIRIIHSAQHRGIAAALNAGLAAAQGDVIMRCDADDLYAPDRIIKQVEWLLRNPAFDAICSGYMAIDRNSHQIVKFSCGEQAEEITSELRHGITRTHFCTFAIRARALRGIGGFRHYFHTSEDIDLQLRLGEHCRVWYTPDVYYQYRIHNASITHTCSDRDRQFFEGMAREFQQQRHTYGIDDLQRGYLPQTPYELSDTTPLTAARHMQNLLIGKAWREHYRGNKWHAVCVGARSAMLQPNNWLVWQSWLALLLKPAGKGLQVAMDKPSTRLI